MRKWSVRRVPGRGFGIFDTAGRWHDTEPTHASAMEWAYWYALTEDLSMPGALAEFRRLKDDADWWRAYLRAVDELDSLEPLRFTGRRTTTPPKTFTLSEALTCGTCWSGEDDE